MWFLMKSLGTKILVLLLVVVFTNCSDNSNMEETPINEWTKRSDIPEYALRLNANVVTYKNNAFLLPGKGGDRFSSRPEILKYSDNKWTQVTTYNGLARAGSSNAIRNKDVIYILGV